MCGITGLVRPPGERADPALVQRMTDTLTHRGPDAQGVHPDGNVALGHRRLAIIDVSREADQPQFNEDSTVVVTFNGEIYNFQELRAELVAYGHRMRTDHSDTEVIVHGWEEWGEGLVDRLRGMFVFAILDRRRQVLFLARDRMGKKPLYTWSRGGSFAFGSEIKALLALPEVGRELDPAAAGEYLVYGNTVSPRTIWSEIHELPPASHVSFDLDAPASQPRVVRYWQPIASPDDSLSAAEWIEEMDHTLAEAVRLRMISDVPLGAFLSGGIDSSLVVSYMAQASDDPIETFTIGFAEAEWDESSAARAIAEHLRTQHQTEVVTPDAAAILPELVEVYDEPFGDASAIPTYYVAKMTRKHVTVALSGDGGDEMFYGYTRYREASTLHQWGRRIGPIGRGLSRGIARCLPAGSWWRRGFDRLSHRGFDLYHHQMGFSEVFRSLLSEETQQALGGSSDQSAAEAFLQPEGLDFLERCRLMDLTHYLPDQILEKADRAAMRHGLEVRCPLLDQEVVELALRIPSKLQVDRRGGKKLLRELAFRQLPKSLLDRPKQGFSVPLGRWLRGPLAPLLERAVADTASPTWRFFDRTVASRRLAAHRSGRVDHGPALWRLLFFHTWAERFVT